MLRAKMSQMTSKRMTRVCLRATFGIVLAGATACTSNLGNFTVGAGNMTSPAVPTKVTSMTTGLVWNVVSPGDSHTCAVEQGGATYCWGCNVRQQAGSVGAGPVSLATNAGAEKSAFHSLSSSSA